jgi:NADPH:quinone reductase-like Zn-dependent oxidoreductase
VPPLLRLGLGVGLRVWATQRGHLRLRTGDSLHLVGISSLLLRSAYGSLDPLGSWKSYSFGFIPTITSVALIIAVTIAGSTAPARRRANKRGRWSHDRASRAGVRHATRGSVGTFAVQLATHFGAHVTGVCSTSNVELVKSLGADEVVDYTRQDFTEAGQIYDIIFDAVGKGSPRRGKRVLAENGSYVSVRSSTQEKTEDLLVLRDLMGAGEVKAVIDRRYSLEQIPEAHRYVEKDNKRGNVVITVGSWSRGPRSTCRVRVHNRSRRPGLGSEGGMPCGS